MSGHDLGNTSYVILARHVEDLDRQANQVLPAQLAELGDRVGALRDDIGLVHSEVCCSHGEMLAEFATQARTLQEVLGKVNELFTRIGSQS